MKKNTNKGFTLIELLAVIVILGILTVYAIPQLMGVFDRSRNRVYASDALKLISLVEHELRSNNSKIEKPENGDCIVVTMNYLSADDFDSPPNDGRYIRERSFVVVKNSGGKMSYSAVIVEGLTEKDKTKPKSEQTIVGYKGIPLSTYDQLSNSKSGNLVKTFKKAQVDNIYNSASGGCVMVYNN